MREILFRGKRLDDGEWVEGYYVDHYGAMIFLLDGLDGTDMGFGFDYYYIDRETIGQYTGLTDKNGKKIFEGDVVKISDIDKRFVCAWERHNFEYEFQNETMTLPLCGVHKDEVEIIGNIHDNPELLKGVTDDA